MNSQFVCLYMHATREEALERIAQSRHPADALAWVYVMDPRRRLRGAIPLADVLRSPEGSVLDDVVAFLPPRLTADTDLEEVARMMTDYDLTVAPVVDEHRQMIGVVTVDDVLELVIPRGWRRRFDVLGGE